MLFGSVDSKAQFRLLPYLNPEAPEVADLSYAKYPDQVMTVFSPEEENILLKSGYRSLHQGQGVMTMDYVQKKALLFIRDYNASPDSEHFLEKAILGIYHSNVRKEVYCAAPKMYSSLIKAAQAAVGLVTHVNLRPIETKTGTGGELQETVWEEEGKEDEPLTGTSVVLFVQ